MKKSRSDLVHGDKNGVLVSREDLAERCSSIEPGKEQLYEINAKKPLQRKLVFLEFLLSRPAPNIYSGRKRSNNYRYIKYNRASSNITITRA